MVGDHYSEKECETLNRKQEITHGNAFNRTKVRSEVLGKLNTNRLFLPKLQMPCIGLGQGEREEEEEKEEIMKLITKLLHWSNEATLWG